LRFLTALRCSVITLLISMATWTVEGRVLRIAPPSLGGGVPGGGAPSTRSTFQSDVPALIVKFKSYTRDPAAARSAMAADPATRSAAMASASAFECLSDRGW
jgi:hypothetical protein